MITINEVCFITMVLHIVTAIIINYLEKKIN